MLQRTVKAQITSVWVETTPKCTTNVASIIKYSTDNAITKTLRKFSIHIPSQ